MKRTLARVALAVAALALPIAPAAAQDAVSLQKALDKPVNLTMKGSIGEVFAKLTAQTGVKFVIDPDALACLPYGDQTQMEVGLENAPLRKALTPVLAPVALQWVLENDSVRILPTEPLYRMCRRATYDELGVLGKLHSVRLAPPAQGAPVLDQLRKATENKDLNILFRIPADKEAAFAQADKALPGTGLDWLDMLCQGKEWTWYLSGDSIVILDRKAQIARQLQQVTAMRYQNEKLSTVLLDLARRAHVTLAMEPGVMNYLPGTMRDNFNLVMADTTVAQALAVISGATGLKFAQTDEGIRVEASDALRVSAGETQPARKPAAFFVQITLPPVDGVVPVVYIRADDLPDDIRDYIQAEKSKFIDQLRLRAQSASRASTSQPAK